MTYFKDRAEQAAAFTAALHSVVDARPVDLDQRARRNVMSFHGMGGMGKTELTRTLRDWATGEAPGLTEWGLPPFEGTVRSFLIDATERPGVAEVAYQVRDLLGDLRVDWTPFDLAFVQHWSAMHPELMLPTFNRTGHARAGARLLHGVAATTDRWTAVVQRLRSSSRGE